MAITFDRGERVYEISEETFKNLHMKGYMRSYFKDGSLNVATGVPISVINYNSNWIDIALSEDHPFYNLFKELSKDNDELYKTYFVEKNSTSKTKEILTLRANGENIQVTKNFCRLDTRVRIFCKEGIFFDNESDPKYYTQWKFLLDINRIEFI